MTTLWATAFLAVTSTGLVPAVQDTTLLRLVLAAEDARPADSAGLAPLLRGLESGDTLVVRLAVRGIGRQERDALIALLTGPLRGGTPAIRSEAANAIGQSAARSGAGVARRLLEDRVALESDPEVVGTILRTLGRLAVSDTSERTRTETLLVRASRRAGGDAPGPVLTGVAHGLASLYRRTAARHPAATEALERLADLLDARHPPMVRRLAMAALGASLHTDTGMLLQALQDPEREVRRSAALAAFAQPSLPGRERIVRRALRDADPAVRYEALRAFGRHMARREGCVPILEAVEDRDAHASLIAVDLLAQCGAAAAPRLAALAAGPWTGDGWRLPAHAMLALARVAPDQAATAIAAAAAADLWWARMYAARAAQITGDAVGLARLARDPHPNVREAALAGLRERQGHAADSLYLAALTARDYQLLLTAARALDSSPDPAALPALLRALERVTAERRETSRDVRAALLTSIGTLGGPATAPTVRRWTTDFDPAIAVQAAALASRWAGTAVPPAPRPLPPAPVPGRGDLARWERTMARFVIRDLGTFTLRLRPLDAPTNVARFVRMARAGWFDGLTWHRIAPNFVVQGGSPGANEYMGDGPFTRDELGLGSHTRGTVGISTRGRDTGDGQLFINLIDNWRLDHDYTIIGEVVNGMGIVDAMLEGAVIERVELVEEPR